MQQVSELALSEMPVEQQSFGSNPYPYLAAAREVHPWLARCESGYVVHEYEAMKELMNMNGRLIVPCKMIVDLMKGHGTNWGRFQLEFLEAHEGADHERYRGSVSAAFTPRSVNGYRDRIRAVISALLDEWAPKGAFDFAEFASYFPISVMFGLIGAPAGAIPKIRWALEMMGRSYDLNPDLLPDLVEAFDELWAFTDQLIAERRSGAGAGGNDILDQLIAANDAGKLTDTELRDVLIHLFVGGYDTSKNQLTVIMYLMLRRPAEEWKRCGDDPEFSAKVVTEAFRHTSIANVFRSTVEDVAYRDVLFPAGTMIVFPLGLSGRDPRAFPDRPDEFLPDRKQPNPHLAFARGIHICLGQFLARAQIEEGLHLIARRIANPRQAGEVTWRAFPGAWGLNTLPITFDPAPAP